MWFTSQDPKNYWLYALMPIFVVAFIGIMVRCVGRCLGDVSFMAVAPASEMVPGNEDAETADGICDFPMDIQVESIGLSKDGVTTRQNLWYS